MPSDPATNPRRSYPEASSLFLWASRFLLNTCLADFFYRIRGNIPETILTDHAAMQSMLTTHARKSISPGFHEGDLKLKARRAPLYRNQMLRSDTIAVTIHQNTSS